MTNPVLSYATHSRHFKNHRYVYPVVSRRAGGVSLGINLNVNNACNWRCVYCQVDGLVRGRPERIDLAILEQELDYMVEWLVSGDFLAKYVSGELRRFSDICISGNGESTLSEDFVAIVELIQATRNKFSLGKTVKTILITNGSEIHRANIQLGLAMIATNNGETWFKIDRATPSGIKQVNQVSLHLEGIIERLQLAAQLCPTYIQSCWFKTAMLDPDEHEQLEFVNLIAKV